MKILHIDQDQFSALDQALQVVISQQCVAMTTDLRDVVHIHMDDAVCDALVDQFGSLAQWQTLDSEQRPWLEIIDPNANLFS
jgi:transposase